MKYIKYIVGAIVVLVVVFFGVRLLNPSVPVTAVGDISNSAKIAQIVLNGGSAATTTVNTIFASLFNGDSNGRVIQEVYYNISGLETNYFGSLLIGTSTLPTGLATTSTMYNSGNLATSTVVIYNASTSPGASGTTAALRLWPSGTYLNFTSSSTQTSGTTTTLTGSGIIGVKYVPNAN